MVRRSALALSFVLGLGTLTGCSGGGPYCDAVDDAKAQLTGFSAKTQANFADNAAAVAAIAEVAPEDVQQQWNKIAKVTKRVVNAQKKSGIAMEELDDEERLNALSQADIDRINAAFEAFNDTVEQREDVVRNVSDECGIDLSEK